MVPGKYVPYGTQRQVALTIINIRQKDAKDASQNTCDFITSTKNEMQSMHAKVAYIATTDYFAAEKPSVLLRHRYLQVKLRELNAARKA